MRGSMLPLISLAVMADGREGELPGWAARLRPSVPRGCLEAICSVLFSCNSRIDQSHQAPLTARYVRHRYQSMNRPIKPWCTSITAAPSTSRARRLER